MFVLSSVIHRRFIHVSFSTKSFENPAFFLPFNLCLPSWSPAPASLHQSSSVYFAFTFAFNRSARLPDSLSSFVSAIRCRRMQFPNFCRISLKVSPYFHSNLRISEGLSTFSFKSLHFPFLTAGCGVVFLSNFPQGFSLIFFLQITAFQMKAVADSYRCCCRRMLVTTISIFCMLLLLFLHFPVYLSVCVCIHVSVFVCMCVCVC